MIRRIYEKLYGKVADQKIHVKITICMLGIDIVLTVFLCLFARGYFEKLYYGEVEIQMQETMNVKSQSLTTMYDTLMKGVVAFSSTPAVHGVVTSASDGDTFGGHGAVENQIVSFLNINDVVSSMFLLNRDGTYYTLYSYGIRPEVMLTQFLDSDEEIDQITWLPAQQSPFFQQQDVIPVVIPLAVISPGKNIVVAEKGQTADTYLILLLNFQKFQQRLSLSNGNPYGRTYFVVDAAGRNISLKNTDTVQEVLDNPSFLKNVVGDDSGVEVKRIMDTQTDLVYMQNLPFSGLHLISVLPKEPLKAKTAAMDRFIIMVGLVGFILATILSVALSRFVTRPFGRLMRNVKAMEENSYNEPYETLYHDEIGQLNNALNSMYGTIQNQICQIKDDEHKKYQLEIQLLAEQINPHLLYNTLEGINLEVLNNHTLAASAMINNLATFMRIGLNCGNELITVENEIAHVESYINIMNHRLNKCIDFHAEVADELKDFRILKLILQPLVENSIKHGFQDNMGFESVYISRIDVVFSQERENIRIEVADNGCGIDREKAMEAVLHQNEDTRHIGLHNVYARLKIYYGEVHIDFETIPFFKNSVIITIPAKKEKQ